MAIDLLLWLAPPLSVNTLAQRFLQAWEGLVRTAYTQSQLDLMSDMLEAVREGVTLLGQQINLLDVLAGSWFSPASLIAGEQVTRFNFLSELILAPAGLVLPIRNPVPATAQGSPIEIQGLWAIILIVSLFWLVAQVISVFWMRWAAQGMNAPGTAGTSRPANPAGQGATGQGWQVLPMQIGQLVAFALVLGVLVFLLRLPLAFALALLLMSGSAIAAAIFALIGGVTLWIMLWLLVSLYFTSEGLMFERQPLWRSMLQGVAMMRGNVLATLALVALINLLLVGFRVVWGIAGSTPVGSLVAIAGNAYLATAMLLAVFSYYSGLRSFWAATQASKIPSKERSVANDNQQEAGRDEGPTSKDE